MTEAHDLRQTRDVSLPLNHRLVEKADVTISVVMPAYNCQSMIENSLRPLLEMQHRGEVFEVIVVDDGSTDGTAGVAASLGATVISTDGPHGPGSARNRGVQAARGDILWFVDADVVVKTDACRHVRHALASREISAVVGSYDDSPPARNFCSQYKNLVHHHYHQRSRGDVSSFWAGCGAVWKDAFLLVSRGRAGNELNVLVTERVRAVLACLTIACFFAGAVGLISWRVSGVLFVIALAATWELFALSMAGTACFCVRRYLFSSSLLAVQHGDLLLKLCRDQIQESSFRASLIG